MARACIVGAGLALVMISSIPSRSEVTQCNEILAVPAVISQTGVYCLKQDLTYSSATGNAITVNANNVVIELNSFKLGGFGGGLATQATGIYSNGRLNVTVRNGTIRGFLRNIHLDNFPASGSGHLVEGIRSESAREYSIGVRGPNSVIRNNIVFETGAGLQHSFVNGIVAEGETGVTVADNIVTGVTGINFAVGIVSSAGNAVLKGNVVRDVSAGSSSVGIQTLGESAILQDNLISSTATGTVGIAAQATNDSCIENVLANNFMTTLEGCENGEGNRTY